MKDQELLEGLVEAARKQELEDARWDGRLLDDLVASKLSRQEIQELAEKSKISAENSLAYRLFTPISEKVRDRIVEKLKSELGAESYQQSREPGKVIKLHTRFFTPRKIFSAAAGLAAAAVLAFILWQPGSLRPELPAYSMSLLGQVKTMRGAEHGPDQDSKLPAYRNGTLLEIILRPDHAVETPLSLSAYLEMNGQFRPIELPVEWDPQGSARIRGVVGKDIQLPLGTYTLWLGLARSGESLDPDRLKALKASGSSQVMTAELLIVTEVDHQP